MTGPLQVYYDGGCPVCAKEIAFYRARPGADGFTWIDVTKATQAELGPDLTPAQALARLYVRRPDGTLISGAAAFAAMWRRMPSMKWRGWLLAVPPFNLGAELGYRGFLLVRKLWR